jgi:phospholipid transport system substrate-binding protein
MIKVILALLVVFGLLQADDTKLVEEKFVVIADDVIKVVQDKALNTDSRNAKIVEVITPVFDFELMAKLSLGKRWKELSADQQKEFISLYVERMKKSYSSKIDKYNDEKIEINQVKQIKTTRIELHSSLKLGEDKLQVVYKYYKPKKMKENKHLWLVYDVEIDGVSILKSDQAQFRDMLKNATIDALMEKLRA